MKKTVEFAVLFDDGTWQSEYVKVPRELPDTQDDHIKWVRENDADAIPDCVSFYVLAFNEDLVDQDDPSTRGEGFCTYCKVLVEIDDDGNEVPSRHHATTCTLWRN